MNKVEYKYSLELLFLLLVSFVSLEINGTPQNDMLLWYNNKPSAVWNEALPIGNGYLGGLVYSKLHF